MKKSKISFKKRIELLDVKRWVCSLGSLAAIITVIVLIDKAVCGMPIKAEEPDPIPEQVEAAEATPETKATATYYEEIPLDAEVQKHILIECDRLNIRPSIVFAMIKQESNYDPYALGDNGDSYGLMQVQPKHHYARMIEYKCTNLYNPIHNTTVGIDYLFELIQKDKGIVWALMAFNGGEKYANDMVASSKISDYAENIINEAERLDAYVLLQ